jgi:hypothetical protein
MTKDNGAHENSYQNLVGSKKSIPLISMKNEKPTSESTHSEEMLCVSNSSDEEEEKTVDY